MHIILGYETIIFDSYSFFVKVNKYVLKKLNILTFILNKDY